MPEIVAQGRGPDVYACGFCHTPGGQGRPENAALAGLPAPYIAQQVLDFKNGSRRSAWPALYRPADRMIHAAMNASEAEVESAATYFAAQKLRTRVRVIERPRVPQAHVVGWVYVADSPRREEPIGVRMLEFAPDAERQQSLDDEMVYIAYVPPGSIDRGRSLAQHGQRNGAAACVSCHGWTLRGTDMAPPIAGRSPTYLLRALLAFKTGARDGAKAATMRAVIAPLELGTLIDAAAFAASRQP
jgi:cytochrome c553